MKKVALVLVVLAALLLSVVPLVSAKGDILLHKVDIGNPTSEAGNVMAGWGPIEPATNGGNWGGFNVTGEDCRVIWDISDDDPSATITLDRGVRPGAAKAIRLRHLDGIADDSFDVQVKDVHGTYVTVGSYQWSRNSAEFWVTTIFPLPNGKTLQLGRGRDVEVQLVATGQKWGGFGTYGQVAFDWIELVGNGKK